MIGNTWKLTWQILSTSWSSYANSIISLLKIASFFKSSSYPFEEILKVTLDIFLCFGEILFNAIVDRLKNLDSWKEKGLDYIEYNVDFPYFILSMDMITCGIRFGYWAHYGNDTLKLYNDISLEDQKDDYDKFITDIKNFFET